MSQAVQPQVGGEAVSSSNPLPVSLVSSGVSSSDIELITSTYTCKTAFTGASVGDTITATQVIDVSGATPSTVATIWRNQTTAADLPATPSAVNLELIGAAALTDAQLRAQPVRVAPDYLEPAAWNGSSFDARQYGDVSIYVTTPPSTKYDIQSSPDGVTWYPVTGVTNSLTTTAEVHTSFTGAISVPGRGYVRLNGGTGGVFQIGGAA